MQTNSTALVDPVAMTAIIKSQWSASKRSLLDKKRIMQLLSVGKRNHVVNKRRRLYVLKKYANRKSRWKFNKNVMQTNIMSKGTSLEMKPYKLLKKKPTITARTFSIHLAKRNPHATTHHPRRQRN